MILKLSISDVIFVMYVLDTKEQSVESKIDSQRLKMLLKMSVRL